MGLLSPCPTTPRLLHLVSLFMLLAVTVNSTLAQDAVSTEEPTSASAGNVSTAASALETDDLILFLSDREWPIAPYLMNSDGSHIRRLTERFPWLEGYEAVFSPDRSQIMFLSVSDEGRHESVYLMNTEGTQLTWVMDDPESDVYITWVPNGNQIGFTSDRDGGRNIYVMNLDGSGVTRLTPADGSYNYEPVWSPDGEKIAFTSTRDEGVNIYVMNADGSDVKPITTGEELYTNALTWSPDSKSLVFISERDGRKNLYRMFLENGEIEQLTFRGDNYDPAWSPDGSKIAFISTRDDSPSLYIMNVDGTGLKPLLSDYYKSFSCPMWTPDSQKIIVLSGPDLDLIQFPNSLYDISIVNQDGSNALALTDDTGVETLSHCFDIVGMG